MLHEGEGSIPVRDVGFSPRAIPISGQAVAGWGWGWEGGGGFSGVLPGLLQVPSK